MRPPPRSTLPASPAGHVAFAPVKTIWFYANLLPAIALGWWAFRWDWAAISAALAFLTICLGHSAGLHRGIIHRSFRCSRWLRNLLAWLFTMTGFGSPLAWLRLHYVRDYWQNQPDAPRYLGYEDGILVDYHRFLHLRYVPTDWERFRIPAEDLEDRWLRFLDRWWLPQVLLLMVATGLVAGWPSVIILFCSRHAAGMLGHWFVGYVAHAHGYRRYRIDGASEEGRNTWLLGVLSFGEGFHNNHHAFPSSARFGARWWEIDCGWYAIRLLARLGLVWNVKSHHTHADVWKPAAHPATAHGIPPVTERTSRVVYGAWKTHPPTSLPSASASKRGRPSTPPISPRKCSGSLPGRRRKSCSQASLIAPWARVIRHPTSPCPDSTGRACDWVKNSRGGP